MGVSFKWHMNQLHMRCNDHEVEVTYLQIRACHNTYNNNIDYQYTNKTRTLGKLKIQTKFSYLRTYQYMFGA